MAKNIYATPRKTPRKSKTLSSKKLKKRATKKWVKKSAKRLAKYRKGGSSIINVKNDTEFYNKIKRKQYVTKKQQKIINKRFKQGYSPFQKIVYDQFQYASEGHANEVRYIWRTAGGLDFIKESFKNYPTEAGAVGAALANDSMYVKSSEQSLYFSDIIFQDEILNPTNYDMTLEIYDIVYKLDTNKVVENDSTSSYNNSHESPLALMYAGTNSVTSSSYTVIADPTELNVSDVGFKPTMSYPFNIYCDIKKKQSFRLQPGATMTHTFKWRPKMLFNLGYLYKYRQISTNIAVKGLTCGVLYRFIGQIASSGANNSSETPNNEKQVANLTAKLAIKETLKYKYYAMDQKYNYIFKDSTNLWGPGDDLDDLEVANNVTIKTNAEMNLDATDN